MKHATVYSVLDIHGALTKAQHESWESFWEPTTSCMYCRIALVFFPFVFNIFYLVVIISIIAVSMDELLFHEITEGLQLANLLFLMVNLVFARLAILPCHGIQRD